MVNIKNTKLMISGKENTREEKEDYPCGCCGKDEISIWYRRI